VNGLSQFLPEGAINTGNVAENRSLAAQRLTLQVKLKREELEYCSFLIENCLYLVWCHLDYYMLRSLPRGFPQVVPSSVLTQGQSLIIMLDHVISCHGYIRFEVFMAVGVKNAIFLNVTPCGL
jgi:hypothetical protein